MIDDPCRLIDMGGVLVREENTSLDSNLVRRMMVRRTVKDKAQPLSPDYVPPFLAGR